MSSTAESLKHATTEAAQDEPSSKKAKLTQPADNPTKPDAGKEITAKDVSSSGGGSKASNNNNNDSNNKSIPTKAANGGPHDRQHTELKSEVYDVDDSDDEMGAFDPKIAKTLEQVEHIQSEICNLNEKASEEILKVEQKFNRLRRPHFEKRNELLKEIPNFWLTSLANHPVIAPMIESAEDEDCLHYMINLDVEEFEDIKSGYRLKLHFVDNPYIANKVIIKEFPVAGSDESGSSTLAEEIQYKDTPEGNNLKRLVETMQEYNVRNTRAPGQVKLSFFEWLSSPKDCTGDDIAEILKEQVWPNPLDYFFATPEEYGADDDDDESDDEDEEIDDEDLDDEDEQNLEHIEIYDEELNGEDDDDDEEDEDEEDFE